MSENNLSPLRDHSVHLQTLPKSLFTNYFSPLFCTVLFILLLLFHNVLEVFCLHFRDINRRLKQEVSRVSVALTLSQTVKFKQLEELSFLHYNLVHLVLAINNLFDVTTLASMVLWFGNIISVLYSLIESFLKDNFLPLQIRFYLFCNVINYLLWLIIVVRMYSRTQREANETSGYIHQIWNQHFQKKNLSEKTRHLQLISCRLLNTKLIFNARGFFRLDETFFHIMIVAVMTYLVILIQFRI
ncbi:putative gustatory receptor 28a [Zophobas morio]|uniref:putative gustatory receptor 28a n=1 Tax=Zophobas morio TaxID=2755281 RepID=UPI0030835D38